MNQTTLPDSSTDQSPVVSFVLPCLNEIQTLEICIQKIRTAIDELDLPAEIVVSDNGSTDGSQALAESLGARVVPAPVRGYGAALMYGIQAARGTCVVMGDADDSYDFREAVKLVRILMEEKKDLVIGTRLKGEIKPGAMPWLHRYLGTPVLSFVVNSLFRSRFSDVNCGMRAFTKAAFDQMAMESTGMEFASEMLVKAAIHKLKIAEVPITLHKDGRDRPPHLRTWSDGWRHLKYILLFAPKAMYWLPACVLMILGTFFLVLLNIHPGGQDVFIGGLRFNDHWIVVGALCMLLGYELLLVGLLANLYTLTHRLSTTSRAMDWIARVMTLEKIILLSFLFLVGGLLVELSVVETWVIESFGPLYAMRPAVTGMVLILMSGQTLFNGLFLNVLSDRYRLLPPTQEEPSL